MLIIFLIVFINMVGFSLILPLLPYYASTFQANETVIGALVGSYAAAQFISAPFLGKLSDRIGRRPVLLVSVLGTALGFLLLGFARSIEVMFLARIVDGLTGGNISVAQAYISDITDEKDRTKGMGLIGAALGLGFIIGPALGGLLSSGGHYNIPAWSAAGFAFVNLTLIFVLLPETISRSDEDIHKTQIRERMPILQILRQTDLNRLLVVRFTYGLAFATFETIFSLFVLKRLGISSTGTGLILTYAGILLVYIQTGGLRQLAGKYQESRLLLSSLIILIPALFLWSLTPNVIVLVLILIPICFSGGILNSVLSSVITKIAASHEVGEVLGISASLESLTRVIAPFLGGFLMSTWGTQAPGIFAAGLALVALMCLREFFKKNQSAGRVPISAEQFL
jgi:DHA1 family tetracycline resistance protein-like MFS transporter